MPNAAIQALDPARYPTRDKELLDEALNTAIGGGSGGGGTLTLPLPVGDGGTSATTAAGARTNLGLAYSYILNRANHNGPAYSPRWFPNRLSGPCWYASPNNTRCRLLVNDADPSVPFLDLEAYGAAQGGDVAFAAASYGLVLTGRYNETLVRLTLDDTDTTAIIINPTKLASSASVITGVHGEGFDYWLAPGCEIIMRGRTPDANSQYRWWQLFIDDRNTTFPILDVERFSV